MRKLTAALAICGAAVFLFSYVSLAAPAPKKVRSTEPKSVQSETYRNLIEKAQNLSLQHDRLQASQILNRAIAREPKNSQVYKELTHSLEELMTSFYTERAQSVFASAESNLPLKPKEAIEGFTEALRLEDGNVTVLKALSRVHLTLRECDKAEPFIKSAEVLDIYSPEVQLLRLQALDCSKSILLTDKLAPLDPALQPLEGWMRGLELRDLLKSEEIKKAKTLISEWESSAPDYPEVFYWKWLLSKESAAPDRAAAQRYTQLCQNLTPRKRKSYNLDVDLCKGKEAVDTFLKEPPHEE